MNQNDYLLLESLIKAFLKDNEIANHEESEVLELFSVYNLTKDYELTISELNESIVDGSLDGGIDAFILIINGKYIYSCEEISDILFSENTTINAIIIQAKSGRSFSEDVLNNLYISLPIILDLSHPHKDLLKRFNPKLAEKILTFRELWGKSAEYRCKIQISYFYVSKGDTKQLNRQILSKKDQILKISNEKIYGATIEFKFIGSRELLDLYMKKPTYRLAINFKETPLPISFNDTEIGFIGVVTLKEFYHLIVDESDNIMEHIFEDNIRHFHGNNDVNKKIAKTLENDLKRDFWWLNNGITIIGSDFTQHGKTLYIDDLQIVNGLQTSFIIDKYFKLNKHKLNGDVRRSILIKVIISKDKETTDKIIAATNNQTYVTSALLRATDDIQRDLEQFFLDKGYYYDRRKNYYRRQNKPLSKIFDIQYTAQCVHAILNRDPATSRSKPTSLIKDDSVYNNIFGRNLNYKIYLNCCLIHSAVKEKLKSFKSSFKDQDFRNQADMLLKNFSFHIARVTPSIYYRKPLYTEQNIVEIDINKLSEQIILEAFEMLVDFATIYGKKYPRENIINTSKSKKFVTELDEYLKKKYENTPQ